MQQEMGINKLANMFMGNPQPLAQKVDQAQRQTKPGEIPPDLKEALALQEIQEAQQHAQNQQALAAGGPQGTIMDKLRQSVQPQLAMQAQAQPGMSQGMPQMPPQGMPQMPPQGMPPVQAAHGGSIAHLVSNLGHHYGGGGIVAFNGEDDSYVSERDKLRRNEAAYNPAMTAGLTGGTETQPVASQPLGQRAMLDKDIAETMALRPEDERDKGAEYYRKTVGLDTLLQELEGRHKAREARHAAAQEGRTPEWVRGLQALGGAPVRGGLGMVLAQAGRGATAARDEYGAQDEKFADEMDRLRDVVTKAKIEGNTGVANAGIAAYKEVDARRRAALQSGATLQKTDEETETRKQIAKDNLLARQQQAGIAATGRADARTAQTDAHFRELALKQANAAAAKLKDPAKLLTGEDAYPNLTQEELANQFFGKFYEQLKSGKIPAAPTGSAGSAPPPGAVRLKS